MQPGTIVYFKRVKEEPRGSKKKEVEFKNYGYGILLGTVPPGFPGPPLDVVLSALGQQGFIRLDDIGEILGAEQQQILMKKWQEKYTKRMEALTNELLESGKVKLVDKDGNPIPPKSDAL